MEKQSTTPRGGYLEALLTSCPVAIVAINGEGAINFVNKEACRLVEREMRELVGHNIAEFYDGPEAAKETNRKMYASGGSVQDHESRVKAKSGKIINVRISASHLKDSAGNYIGAVGYFEPYRPWTAAEKQLKKEVDQLKARVEEWKDICAPMFELYDGISMIAVAGRLDTGRIEYIGKEVLNHIEKTEAKTVIINISGAVVEDPHAADGLVKTVRAARLMGVECMLVGIQAAIARGIESRVDNVGLIRSFRTMNDALEAALDGIGCEINQKG